MKKIFSKKNLILIVASFLMFPCYVSAATFDISVNGLMEPSGINSVTFWFDVDPEFSFLSTDADSTIGNAIPTDGTIGWTAASSLEPGLFKIDAFDTDDALSIGAYPLKNGNIFSFEYSGAILDFNRIEFGVGATNIYPDEIMMTSFDANGATFAPVPLPAAVWLLGSGLVGLAALRRKK